MIGFSKYKKEIDNIEKKSKIIIKETYSVIEFLFGAFFIICFAAMFLLFFVKWMLYIVK